MGFCATGASPHRPEAPMASLLPASRLPPSLADPDGSGVANSRLVTDGSGVGIPSVPRLLSTPSRPTDRRPAAPSSTRRTRGSCSPTSPPSVSRCAPPPPAGPMGRPPVPSGAMPPPFLRPLVMEDQIEPRGHSLPSQPNGTEGIQPQRGITPCTPRLRDDGGGPETTGASPHPHPHPHPFSPLWGSTGRSTPLLHPQRSDGVPRYAALYCCVHKRCAGDWEAAPDPSP